MVWAIGLSILSAVSYAFAAVVQERLAGVGHRGVGKWVGSVGLTSLGVALHVVALKFGTVGVVQSLSTLTLLFAMPVAAIRKHARISAGAWRDAGLTVAGLVAFMSMTAPSDRPALFRDGIGTYLAAGTAVVIIGLAFAAWRATASRVVRGVELACASGIAFALSSVYTKAVFARFTIGGAAIVVVLALAGYGLAQVSFRGAGVAAPVATASVTNPVVSIVVGVLVFGERFRFGGLGVAVAVAAGLVAAIGVVGLAKRQADDTGSRRTAQAEARAMR